MVPSPLKPDLAPGSPSVMKDPFIPVDFRCFDAVDSGNAKGQKALEREALQRDRRGSVVHLRSQCAIISGHVPASHAKVYHHL